MNNTTKYGLIFLGGLVVGALGATAISRGNLRVKPLLSDVLAGGMELKDKVMAGVEGIRQGNRVYYRIVDLDRLFKDKTPKIPAEIRKNYMRSGDALKYYHLGQKRFSEETQAAGVTKVRTEGNYVWYKKDELDKLFKKISDNGSN